jgi:hypothetical protein
VALDEDQRSTRRVVRLSDGRRRIRTAHCARCKRRVLVRPPWPGFRYLRLLWFAALLPIAALLPALGFAPTLTLPAFLVFLMLGGPLNLLARRATSCSRCGAPLPREASGGRARVTAPVVEISRGKKGRSQAP